MSSQVRISMTAASILIIQGGATKAQTIARKVQDLGYEVGGIVASGNAALTEITAIQPDLILMEIVSQEHILDEMISAVKIQQQYQIPVLYLTAHGDASILEQSAMSLPFTYIVEPFSIQDLQVKISMALHRYKLEHKLANHEHLLNTLLNTTRDAVIATNEVGTIIYMNQIAQDLTGWQWQEGIGKQFDEVVQIVRGCEENALVNQLQQKLTQAQDEPAYLHKQAVLINKVGEHIPVADSVAPIITQAGGITGTVIVLSDLSLHQQAQQWKRERAKLTATIKAERELNQLRTQFITMTSHEFRTPLTTILSSSELLEHCRNKWSEEKKLNHLHRIQAEVKSMSHLLDAVLTIGKADAGKLVFTPTLVDLISFCEDVAEELQLSDRYQHRINFTHQGDIRSGYLDINLIQRIITNLLTNAIKYSPNNTTINFSLLCQNNQATLTIQDHGIGIPPQDMEKLFEAFHRANNVGNIQGTGLGLTIVHKCVKLHRGKIQVHSEVNLGTTFTITLPFPKTMKY